MHSTEVSRLVGIAYGRLADDWQEAMALETFSLTLGHSALQRHLLAARPQDMDKAVCMNNKCFQVYTRPNLPRVVTCEEEEWEDDDSTVASVVQAQASAPVTGDKFEKCCSNCYIIMVSDHKSLLPAAIFFNF